MHRDDLLQPHTLGCGQSASSAYPARPTSLALCRPESMDGDSGVYFTDEVRRRLHALPHWQQAEICAFPGGELARELAAKTLLAFEEKGIRL